MTDYERFEAYEPSERSSFGMALMFLFIGMGVGAVTALLFAPRTGKQMRRALRRRYEDAREVIDDWTEQAGDVLDKGAGLASRAKDKVAPLARVLRRD